MVFNFSALTGWFGVDWNFIRIYLAVYREQTIVNAAKSLDMSESTLARHLANNEKSIGKLFIRLNGRYALTDLGQEILESSLNIEKNFIEIDRKVLVRDELGATSVRITAPTSFSYGYLPEILDELKVLHPDINVELLVTNDTLCLNTSQADIALRVTSTPPDNFIGKKVRDIRWGAYAGHEYLLKYGAPKSIKDLENHRLIGASGHLTKHKVFSWLATSFPLGAVLATDDLVAMSHLAEKNQGIAILPDEFDQGKLKRLFTIDAVGSNSLWVLTHRDLRGVERVRIVARYLTKALTIKSI